MISAIDTKTKVAALTLALCFACGAAWAAALTLELLQNWGGEPVAASFYDPAMILEEGLEMVGSTALIMAGLVVLGRSTSIARSSDAAT